MGSINNDDKHKLKEDKDKKRFIPQTEAENLICNQIFDEFKENLIYIKNKYMNNGTPVRLIIDAIDAYIQLLQKNKELMERMENPDYVKKWYYEHFVKKWWEKE